MTENAEITLKEAATRLKMLPAGLWAVMRVLHIEPKMGRSKSNRVALLLTAKQFKKIQEALK